MHGGYGPCGAPGAWGDGRRRREQHSRLAPTRGASAGTALRKSAAVAAVQDLGRHGMAQHRRVMEILLIASGGERSKLGVAPQNHACWMVSIVKKTNDDEQDHGFEWVM
jgi:hypothetical protein